MRHFRLLGLGCLTAAAVALATPRADACGGTFCNSGNRATSHRSNRREHHLRDGARQGRGAHPDPVPGRRASSSRGCCRCRRFPRSKSARKRSSIALLAGTVPTYGYTTQFDSCGTGGRLDGAGGGRSGVGAAAAADAAVGGCAAAAWSLAENGRRVRSRPCCRAAPRKRSRLAHRPTATRRRVRRPALLDGLRRARLPLRRGEAHRRRGHRRDPPAGRALHRAPALRSAQAHRGGRGRRHGRSHVLPRNQARGSQELQARRARTRCGSTGWRSARTTTSSSARRSTARSPMATRSSPSTPGPTAIVGATVLTPAAWDATVYATLSAPESIQRMKQQLLSCRLGPPPDAGPFPPFTVPTCFSSHPLVLPLLRDFIPAPPRSSSATAARPSPIARPSRGTSTLPLLLPSADRPEQVELGQVRASAQ